MCTKCSEKAIKCQFQTNPKKLQNSYLNSESILPNEFIQLNSIINNVLTYSMKKRNKNVVINNSPTRSTNKLKKILCKQ